MRIEEILENKVIVSLLNAGAYSNLVNHYVLFKDEKMTIGEIIEVKNQKLIVNLIGEIINNDFSFGISTKPSFNSSVDLISKDSSNIIISYPDDNNNLCLGYSSIFKDIKVYLNLNSFFNSHFAILGGTGSGKSFALSRIIQTLFENKEKVPYNASIFVFDTYGEYYPSFTNLENNNSNIAFKNYTTNISDSSELLKIPPYLLGIDDLALLLNATESCQLQVLEKALDLVNIFKRNDDDILKIQNDIIARAILDILLSGRPSVQVRDQIFSVLSFYKTSQLNLDSTIYQPGYNRALKNCLVIDNDGKIREMELLVKFFMDFIIDNADENNYTRSVLSYTLEDLENAIDFALISEGVLKSEKIYDKNYLLKVRIHDLVNSDNKKLFEYSGSITKENYIKNLMMKNGKKAQLINFNINYIDDRLSKIIVKILTKMLFDVAKTINPRGTMPFHIILEEAHRYVQNDSDINLLGYNIFERIAKEGRKYGVLLGLITQRPSELSETTLSQCNNFLIFKMTHPKDIDYVNNLVPFMTKEISSRLQSIPPGNCYLFGSAFKLPTMIKLELPNPTPISNNVNILSTWYRSS